MKIRWRQHEIIFVTAIVSFKSIQLLVESVSATNPQIHFFETLFLEKGLAFDYLRNYLFPHLVPLAVLYLIFLFVNLYLIPKWVEKTKRPIIVFLYSLLCWVLLILTFTISYYYEGFYLQYEFTSGELMRKALQYGFSISGSILVSYTLYLFLRDTIGNIISREKSKRAFLILLTDRITATVFIYLGGFIFLYVFGALRTDVMGIFFVFFLVPLIISVFINVFGLFPYQYRYKIPFLRFLWKLLIAPFALSLISFAIFIIAGGQGNLLLPTAILLFQLLLGMPLSWLIYRQQSDKLESIELLKNDLGKISADLQFLRSQINPHFLFNTLNTMYGTALQENASRTADGIQRLGDMMRFMLQENLKEKIPVSREVEYLQNYILIQELRTSQSPEIFIHTNLPSAFCPHEIAPMLLIPLVENAFKHGISLNQKSWIKMDLFCTAAGIKFDIHNSIHKNQENDPEHKTTGIGLDNVRQRLQFLYPSKYELAIHQSETEYFVHLNITLI